MVGFVCCGACWLVLQFVPFYISWIQMSVILYFKPFFIFLLLFCIDCFTQHFTRKPKVSVSFLFSVVVVVFVERKSKKDMKCVEWKKKWMNEWLNDGVNGWLVAASVAATLGAKTKKFIYLMDRQHLVCWSVNNLNIFLNIV